jgi:two-component system LytT family response regulator
LERVGAADVFLKARNSFAVARDKLDCDFYSFLRGDSAAVNAYFGEYMTQYSWAEMTLGSLKSDDRR